MRRKIFFLDWETNGQKFMQDVTLSPQAQQYVQMFVFYKSKELPPRLLPRFRFLHLPRIAVVKSFDSTEWSSLVAELTRKNPRCSIPEKKDFFVVSTNPDAYFGKLIELLKVESVDFQLLTTQELSAILDDFRFKCLQCKMIFENKSEWKKHERNSCGYFDKCLNRKAKRKVGFSERSEFQDLVPDSQKCDLCLENCIFTYCPHTNRKENMKIVQKTRYVGKTHDCWSKHDTNEFSAHFMFGYDTLPCLALHGCPRIFQSLQDQAHHHLTEHGSLKPYFCMVCYKMLKIMCFESEGELLFHGKLEGHCEPDFAFA